MTAAISPFCNVQIDTTELKHVCNQTVLGHPLTFWDELFNSERYFTNQRIHAGSALLLAEEKALQTLFNERVQMERNLDLWCHYFQMRQDCVGKDVFYNCLQTLDRSIKHNTYGRLVDAVKKIEDVVNEHFKFDPSSVQQLHASLQKTKQSVDRLACLSTQENNVWSSLATFVSRLGEEFAGEVRNDAIFRVAEQDLIQALTVLDDAAVKRVGVTAERYGRLSARLRQVIETLHSIQKACKESASFGGLSLGSVAYSELALQMDWLLLHWESVFLLPIDDRKMNLFLTLQNAMLNAIEYLKKSEMAKQEISNPGEVVEWENWISSGLGHLKKMKSAFDDHQLCSQPFQDGIEKLNIVLQTLQNRTRELQDSTLTLLMVGKSVRTELDSMFESSVLRYIHSSDSAVHFRTANRTQNAFFISARKLQQNFSVRFLPGDNYECYATRTRAYPILGMGSFKKVRYAFSSRIGRFATVSLQKRVKDILFQNEVYYLRRVQGHPSFVQLLDVLPEYTGKWNRKKIRFNLELCDQGDLYCFLSKCPDLAFEQRLILAKQIAAGCLYLHTTLKVIHRDLKAKNIFLRTNLGPKMASMAAKIGDMASCCRIDDTASRMENCSTVIYVSSEYAEVLVAKKSLIPVATTGLDIWALACIFWQLFSGANIPWNIKQSPDYDWRKEMARYWRGIKKKSLHGAFEGKSDISDVKIYRLVAQMMDFDPNKRITAEGVCSYLEEHYPSRK